MKFSHNSYKTGVLTFTLFTILAAIAVAVLVKVSIPVSALDNIERTKGISDKNSEIVLNTQESFRKSAEDAAERYSRLIYYKERLETNLDISDILLETENTTRSIIKRAIENDKILFIGNSLVEGWRISTDTNNKFLCKVGVSFSGLDNVVYRYLSSVDFDVAVIEMGTNELGGYSEDNFKSGYRELIERVKDRNENCIIICVSIPPVSRSKSNSGTRFNNNNVELYNNYVKDVVSEYNEDVYYVDCNQFFGNELNSKWTRDGIHMSSGVYKEWFTYVLNKMQDLN